MNQMTDQPTSRQRLQWEADKRAKALAHVFWSYPDCHPVRPLEN
jgi:hypothetical protein